MNKYQKADQLIIKWAVQLAADHSAGIPKWSVADLNAHLQDEERQLAMMPMRMAKALNITNAAASTLEVLKEMYATIALNISVQSLKQELFDREHAAWHAAYLVQSDLIAAKRQADRDAYRTTHGLPVDSGRSRYVSRAERAAVAAPTSPATYSRAETESAPPSTA